MKNAIAVLLLMSSSVVLAGGPGGKTGPAKWDRDDQKAERFEERERKMRMALVVGLADAMGITDAGEAVKLDERVKGFDEKRRPLRQQMFEAVKTLKAAADGEQAALGQVDASVAKVLDGRAQLAALDKEMFASLSAGLTPQKRAKLALFLGKFHMDMARMAGGGGGGRRMRDDE